MKWFIRVNVFTFKEEKNVKDKKEKKIVKFKWITNIKLNKDNIKEIKKAGRER